MFIRQNQTVFSMQAMCKMLQVSRAGFYAWLKRPESQRQCDDKIFIKLIKESFNHSRQTYGHRRIHADLKGHQHNCGRDRVRRLMRENQLRPKNAESVQQTVSKSGVPDSSNVRFSESQSKHDPDILENPILDAKQLNMMENQLRHLQNKPYLTASEEEDLKELPNRINELSSKIENRTALDQQQLMTQIDEHSQNA